MPSLKKTLSIAALVACCIFFALYIRNHLSEFTNINEISLTYVLLIGGITLVSLVVNGIFLRVLTVEFGIDLGFFEYSSISIMTSFGNVFLPMGWSAGLRAIYLKSKYDFDYSYFLSTLAGNYLLIFNVCSLVGLGGLGIFYVQNGGLSLPVAVVLTTIAAATSWAIIAPPVAVDWIPFKRTRERVNQVLLGWQTIRKSGKTVRNLIWLTLLNVLLASLATWLEFAAFHIQDAAGNGIGFLQSFIFTIIGSLSIFFSITPAALGIKESILMFSSQFLGITPSQALAVSLLDRTVTFLVLAVFFGFASIYIRRRLIQSKAGL